MGNNIYTIKKMKYILSILITLFAVQAIAQPTPTYTGSYTQMSYNRGSVGALRLQYIPRGFYPFPTFDTLGTIWVDSAMTRGLFYHNGIVRLRLATVPYVDSAILTAQPDSAVWATRYYTDSGLASISAGAVDTNNYIASITRLNREIDSIANIIDSNNTIIYGSLTDLYENKADKDTLNNFVLHTYLDSTLAHYADTGLLALKQNYSDTLTFDATRYYVDTGNAAIRATKVPYTGAIANLDLGVRDILARNGVINHPSGSGTALSVTKGGAGEALTVTKTSGAGNAMSVTGGITLLETLHTTNPIADAYIASAATWNAKGNGSVTSIQLVGGTGVTITPTTAITTSGTYTISATGGGGGSPIDATTGQVLYKSGSDTLKGAAKAGIDTTDGRLSLINATTTANITPAIDGGMKVYADSYFGNATLSIKDTAGFEEYALNSRTSSNYGEIFPTVSNAITNIGYFVASSGIQVPSGTTTVSAQNSGVPLANFNRITYRTSAAASQTLRIRVGSAAVGAGILFNNSKYTGGGRMSCKFGVPDYNSGHRYFFGIIPSTSDAPITTDPSTQLNSVGLGKDEADLTWQIMHNDGSGTATKINTGLTPNANYMYRISIHVPHRGTPVYVILDEMSDLNTVNTYRYELTTDLPIQGSKPYTYIYSGNVSTLTTTAFSIIHLSEENY